MIPEDADLVRSLELAANPMCWRAADAIERLSAEKEAAEADADALARYASDTRARLYRVMNLLPPPVVPYSPLAVHDARRGR